MWDLRAVISPDSFWFFPIPYNVEEVYKPLLDSEYDQEAFPIEYGDEYNASMLAELETRKYEIEGGNLKIFYYPSTLSKTEFSEAETKFKKP